MLQLSEQLLFREPSLLGEQSSLPGDRCSSNAPRGVMLGTATSGQTPLGVAPAVVGARLLTVDEHPKKVLEPSPGEAKLLHTVEVVELPLREFSCLKPGVPLHLEPLLRNVAPSEKA